MKVTVKLTLAITGLMLVVMAILAALAFRREDELFVSDMMHDDHLIGLAMAIAEEQAWESPERARQLLEEMNSQAHYLSLRLVNLNAQPGDPDFLASAMNDPNAFASVETSRHLAVQDASYLYTYVPLSADPTGATAIEVRESLAARDAYRQTTLLSVGSAALLMLALATLAAFGLGAWLIGRPLRALVEFSQTLGAGDYTRRVGLGQRDEIGTLGRAMNEMAAQIADAKQQLVAETTARMAFMEQLRHTDRLKTVGILASGLAHELGTPLNVISGRAKLIMSGAVNGAESLDNARIIKEQTERMSGIIRQVLDFARRRPSEKETTDLKALIERTRLLLEPLATKSSALIETAPESEAAEAWINAGQVEQVVTNLVVNAVQAMPKGDKVTIGVRKTHARPPADLGEGVGTFVELWVADQGVGIAARDLPRIFEPFYTTKDVGVGTGLGLSVAYSIVRENDGWFDVKSEPDKGSRFSVFLPAEKQP